MSAWISILTCMPILDYSFRLPYYEWRVEIQKTPAEELFIESGFGAIHNVSRFPKVVGDINVVGSDVWLEFFVWASKFCDV